MSKRMKWVCQHESVDHLFKGDIIDSDFCRAQFMAECEQLRCIDCAAWLPLGPSADDTENVKAELLAAGRGAVQGRPQRIRPLREAVHARRWWMASRLPKARTMTSRRAFGGG